MPSGETVVSARSEGTRWHAQRNDCEGSGNAGPLGGPCESSLGVQQVCRRGPSIKFAPTGLTSRYLHPIPCQGASLGRSTPCHFYTRPTVQGLSVGRRTRSIPCGKPQIIDRTKGLSSRHDDLGSAVRAGSISAARFPHLSESSGFVYCSAPFGGAE